MSINDYKLEKQIGSGSFGDVYRGIIKHTGEKVAIKRLRKKVLYENGKYLLKAFYREIECMKKCACENSIKFINEFQTQNNYNIVMELCDTDLLCHLYEQRKDPFTAEEIRDIFSQLNNAFRKMSQNNILHRDLKLGNVLIKFTDESKTKFIPKLTDYGFSKELNRHNYASCTHLGTPATMAPEIIMNQPFNNKSDLWSVGVMMYQLYYKEVPYDGNSEPEILQKIQSNTPYKQPKEEDLRDLINKLLVVNVEKRLSWNEYFDHPFFNPNKKNNYYNNNKNNIRNSYDYTNSGHKIELNINNTNVNNNNNNNNMINNVPNTPNNNLNVCNSFSFSQKCISFNKDMINKMNNREIGYSCNSSIFEDNNNNNNNNHNNNYNNNNNNENNNNHNNNNYNNNNNNNENNNNNNFFVKGNIYESNNDNSLDLKESDYLSGEIHFFDENQNIELIGRGEKISDKEYQIITQCCTGVIDNFKYPFSHNSIKKIESQLNGDWFVLVFTEKDNNFDFFFSETQKERYVTFKYKDNIFQIYQIK